MSTGYEPTLQQAEPENNIITESAQEIDLLQSSLLFGLGSKLMKESKKHVYCYSYFRFYVLFILWKISFSQTHLT